MSSQSHDTFQHRSMNICHVTCKLKPLSKALESLRHSALTEMNDRTSRDFQRGCFVCCCFFSFPFVAVVVLLFQLHALCLIDISPVNTLLRLLRQAKSTAPHEFQLTVRAAHPQRASLLFSKTTRPSVLGCCLSRQVSSRALID